MKLKKYLTTSNLPVSLFVIGITAAALSSGGCEQCGGLGTRGPIPDAPYGASDDTSKIVSGAYISIEYYYKCLEGETVRAFYHSASECIDYEFSETRGGCDSSSVIY